MKIEETKLKGCFILQPTIFKDSRGYFMESFNTKAFTEATGIINHFVQDNESLSSKNVLRGLHYQIGAYAQSKLVRVIKGSVLDVVVDIRPNSQTFGQHFKIILSEENKTQLYIPRGFAHGFIVLEDNTLFSYKCDNFYHQPSERGIIFNDTDLDIDWKVNKDVLLISEKDKALPTLKNAEL